MNVIKKAIFVFFIIVLLPLNNNTLGTTLILIYKDADCSAGVANTWFKAAFWNPIEDLPHWDEAIDASRWGLIQLETFVDLEQMELYDPGYSEMSSGDLIGYATPRWIVHCNDDCPNCLEYGEDMIEETKDEMADLLVDQGPLYRFGREDQEGSWYRANLACCVNDCEFLVDLEWEDFYKEVIRVDAPSGGGSTPGGGGGCPMFGPIIISQDSSDTVALIENSVHLFNQSATNITDQIVCNLYPGKEIFGGDTVIPYRIGEGWDDITVIDRISLGYVKYEFNKRDVYANPSMVDSVYLCTRDSIIRPYLAIDDRGDTITAFFADTLDTIYTRDDPGYIDLAFNGPQGGSRDIWHPEGLGFGGGGPGWGKPPIQWQLAHPDEIPPWANCSVYDPSGPDWVVIDSISPLERISAKGFIIPDMEDYEQNGIVKIRISWENSFAIAWFHLFEEGNYEKKSLDFDSLLVAVDSDGDTITTHLKTAGDQNTFEMNFAEYIDIYFEPIDWSESAGDSALTYIFQVVGYSEMVDDSEHFKVEVNYTTDTITVQDTSGSAVQGAVLCITSLHYDSTEYGQTNASGKYGTDINLDGTYDIYISKRGYFPYKVQHHDTLYGNETWGSDIGITGDVVAESGDTLTILEGTNIYLKHTSADWNYANDYGNKTELMAYGGHIIVEGDSGNIVHFHPSSGGSGLYQFGGLWAKAGGSYDVRWAQFDSCDGVGGVQGGSGPGNGKLVHTRHIGNQGVFGDWRNATPTGWFQMDTCYVEGRVMWLANGDSCWARACSLSQSVTAHECFYVISCSSTVYFEACSLFGYTSQGGRNEAGGKLEFFDCAFKGDEKAVSQQGELFLDSCRVDVSDNDYAIYEPSVGADTKSRNTTYDNYDYAGIYLRNDADFGVDVNDKGHNCFHTNGANYTFYAYSKPTIYVDAEYNYFDTLKTGGSISVSATHRDKSCVPFSFPKVFGSDGKPIIPRVFALGDAVPNPFNSTVAVEFDVPKEAEVTVEIFNILGKKIVTLIDEELSAGRYKAVWDSRDGSGRTMPSGTYLYRMRALDGDFEETKKMTLIK